MLYCLCADAWLCLTVTLWTRLLCPWNFSGKNTGAGCHFPLPCSQPREQLCVSCISYTGKLGILPHLSLCHLGILPLGNCLLKLSAATQEFCFPSLASKVTPKFGGLKQQPFYEISWFYGQWLSWVILCSMEDQTGPKRVVLGWSQVHLPEYHTVWTSTERSLRLHHLPGPQMGTAGRWFLLSPLHLLEVPGSLSGFLSWVVTHLQGDSEQGPGWKLPFTCRRFCVNDSSRNPLIGRARQRGGELRKPINLKASLQVPFIL